MTICAIYPAGTVLPHELPASRHRELRLVEAWPGSIVTVEAFKDEYSSVPHQLFGFVLDFAGELPADRIGILFVLMPEEISAARAHNTAATREPRHYRRTVEGASAWEAALGNGDPPPEFAATTACRMVEAWPGSVRVSLGRNGDCPQIDGIVHSIEGELPTGLLGLPVMMHLADCPIHRGIPECDCFEVDEHNEATGRRPR